MRLTINLATQPYEDARQFYARWGIALGVLALLAIILSFMTLSAWNRYRSVSRDIGREKETLRKLDKQQADDLAILAQPQNNDVRQRSIFLNDLIERKSVSWTHIFSDLEKIMPPQLHVVAIQPKVEHGDVLLEMAVVGQSRERALELVRKMEQSQSFRDAQVLSESVQNQNNGPETLRFTVSAQYVPQSFEAVTALEANAGGGQQ
jgi:type IV pilus assembly protein PilN